MGPSAMQSKTDLWVPVFTTMIGLSLLLGSCGLPPNERWEAVTIDGQPAPEFVLVTRARKVIGGHDGCNGWGLADQPGMIVSDAQECPPDPMRDVYWLLARGGHRIRTASGNELVIRSNGHCALFRRA